MEDFDLTPEAIEEQVAAVNQVDEFNEGMNYDKFIVLSKKDITNFCRVVEPLTKQAIDDYGKSVHVRCVGEDKVELVYVNTPYLVSSVVPNKSTKQVSEFTIAVSTLKRLVTQAFASLVLVENDGEMNIALCESLLYLETKPLAAEEYLFEKKETPDTIDKEGALYTFKKIGASLALTERASEKVVVVDGTNVNFNTGVFVAKSKSPFSTDQKFVLYKQVSDIIATLAEFTKVSMQYGIEDDILTIQSEGFYVQCQVGGEDKVKEFTSEAAEAALKFEASVTIINDNLLRIITVVKNLDYLSDIVALEFTDKAILLKISNAANTKSSAYTFNIMEGKPSQTGEMKVTTDVLKLFLSIVGTDCKYDMTTVGMAIQTAEGKFIIRKS